MEIMTMADNRKVIVKAVAEHLGENSVYLGPPTFAYQVGCARIDREGKVIVEDVVKGEAIRKMLILSGLAKGILRPMETVNEAEENTAVIQVPLDGMDAQGIKNILNMLHSKQYLMNCSIGVAGFKVSPELISSLETAVLVTAGDAIAFVKGMADFGKGFDFKENSIVFSGFPYTEDGIRLKAYAELAALMVSQAKAHKRISPKETIEENEKYYMRTWLIRLGLGGQAAKETRRELLKNLKGHTAFRTDAEKLKWLENQKVRMAAKKVAASTADGDANAELGDV